MSYGCEQMLRFASLQSRVETPIRKGGCLLQIHLGTPVPNKNAVWKVIAKIKGAIFGPKVLSAHYLLTAFTECHHINTTIALLSHPQRPPGAKDTSQVRQPGIHSGRPRSAEQLASRHPVIQNCHCIQELPEVISVLNSCTARSSESSDIVRHPCSNSRHVTVPSKLTC